MKKRLTIFGYFILVNVVFIIDRVTKNLAMLLEGSSKKILPGVSAVFVKNRGISWGMFYTQSTFCFYLMLLVIGLVIALLSIYTYKRWLQNRTIIGELLVLSGAVSNLLDRIIHCGVIDFIELSYNDWCIPVFNIADCAIVLGVCLMLITLWRES